MKVSGIPIGLSVGLSLLLQQCIQNSIPIYSLIGEWSRRAELEGPARSGAVAFTIGTMAYVGTGLDVSNNSLVDFWKYDPATDTWTQEANFPGKARSEAVAFAIGPKGYLGTGIDAQATLLRDFYEYDPDANIWKHLTDFEGTARRSAVAFNLNDQGFVALGFDGSERADVWRYNSSTDNWTPRKYFGGSARIGAATFVLNNLAYVGAGTSQNVNQNDFWMYDPDKDVWAQRQNLSHTDISASYNVGFSIINTGYFIGGSSGKQVWGYNPTDDSWTQKKPFDGPSRTKALGFAIGSKGYVTTGGGYVNARFDDLWEFDPALP